MITFLAVIGWVIASIPAGILVGRCISFGNPSVG